MRDMDENQETKENIPTSDEASLSKTQARLVHFMKELFEGEIAVPAKVLSSLQSTKSNTDIPPTAETAVWVRSMH